MHEGGFWYRVQEDYKNPIDLSIDLSKLIATSPSYSFKKKKLPIRRYITRVWRGPLGHYKA